jgi:hypothetical protein
MKKVLALLVTAVVILSSCVPEDDGPSYYSINMRVQGNDLTQIYLRSTNWNFDVAPNTVPNISWSVDNRIYGNDSIALYGVQVPDSANKIKVTITLQKDNDLPIIFQDSGYSSAVARGFIPY